MVELSDARRRKKTSSCSCVLRELFGISTSTLTSVGVAAGKGASGETAVFVCSQS